MKRTEPQPRFVVCVNNKDYPASVELRKLYQAFVDATFAGAKKRASPSARPVAARAQRYREWETVIGGDAENLFRVLRHTNHN